MKKFSKRMRTLLLGAFTCFSLASTVYANTDINNLQTINIGQQKVDKLRSQQIIAGRIKKSAEELKISDIALPVYECVGELFVLVPDLKQIGARVTWDPITKATIIYDLNQPVKSDMKFGDLKEDSIAYLGRGITYINYQEIPSIFVEGKTLIPVRWLAFLEMDSEWIRYSALGDAEISGINMWFDGESYVEEPYIFPALAPGEHGYYRDYKYDLDPAYTYVGFLISEVNGSINQNLEIQKSWLQNPAYYTSTMEPEIGSEIELDTQADNKSLDEIFPTTVLKGTMRYATNGFQKGEEVIVQKADSGSVYYVLGKNNKVTKIPWSSITVHKAPVTQEQATNEQIEQCINGKNLESKTNYLVWTDLYRQRTYIFQGSKNNWKLSKNFLSSTGKDISPTPTGKYALTRRVPYFGKGYRAKNAVGFIGTEYLYHSVLYDATGRYLLEGRGILGQKASQGCIRFSPEDSVWFYNTMPLGTTVYIN